MALRLDLSARRYRQPGRCHLMEAWKAEHESNTSCAVAGFTQARGSLPARIGHHPCPHQGEGDQLRSQRVDRHPANHWTNFSVLEAKFHRRIRPRRRCLRENAPRDHAVCGPDEGRVLDGKLCVVANTLLRNFRWNVLMLLWEAHAFPFSSAFNRCTRSSILAALRSVTSLTRWKSRPGPQGSSRGPGRK